MNEYIKCLECDTKIVKVIEGDSQQNVCSHECAMKGSDDLNPILTAIIKVRKGHYCHDLEVNEVYEIYDAIEAIVLEYPQASEKEVIKFFETITLHYLGDDAETEQAIYNFNFQSSIEGAI